MDNTRQPYFSTRRENKHTILNSKILEDPRLSLEGKGVYGMLEANLITLEEVQKSIIQELIEVGYLEEISE